MSEIQLKATNVENKPVRIGDLPIIKTNILENAGQMDKGVVGGYNGAFPLTAASEGGIYLLPSTGKFYVCETAYNGAQISAPNSNFVELSVWKNHDRLANLITVNGANEKLEIKTSFAILKVNKERFLFKEPFKNKCLFIVAQDTGKYGNQMFRIESSPEQSFDKDGFTISASSSLDDGDSFFYFAIGF